MRYSMHFSWTKWMIIILFIKTEEKSSFQKTRRIHLPHSLFQHTGTWLKVNDEGFQSSTNITDGKERQLAKGRERQMLSCLRHRGGPGAATGKGACSLWTASCFWDRVRSDRFAHVAMSGTGESITRRKLVQLVSSGGCGEGRILSRNGQLIAQWKALKCKPSAHCDARA